MAISKDDKPIFDLRIMQLRIFYLLIKANDVFQKLRQIMKDRKILFHILDGGALKSFSLTNFPNFKQTAKHKINWAYIFYAGAAPCYLFFILKFADICFRQQSLSKIIFLYLWYCFLTIFFKFIILKYLHL